MTVLKENTELQSKVDEDEDDIETLTEKNRQLVKQVRATMLNVYLADLFYVRKIYYGEFVISAWLR